MQTKRDLAAEISASSRRIRPVLLAVFRNLGCARLPASLLAVALCPVAQARQILPACPLPKSPLPAETVTQAALSPINTGTPPAGSIQPSATPAATFHKLIVIGFMGGNVRAGNLVHREASMAKDLQQRYPLTLHAAVFANSDGDAALASVLQLLDKNKDGCLSVGEKDAARIVIYGHSWGASETVTLARKLNHLGIPVLLTVQVDSVEKLNEHDGRIPPNVRQAVNFYQSEGLLHGRRLIEAMDPQQTTILGNFESDYKEKPVSCAGYPWYARAFMKPHIEIENDPLVWNRIETLIQGKLL